MSDLKNISKGLPRDLKSKKPVLEQYLYKKTGTAVSGSLLFENGEIFYARKNGSGEFEWAYFTHLKNEGVEKLKILLKNDFLNIESNEEITGTQNCMIWISNLGAESHQVKVNAGLYSGLPSVFKKAEDIINNNLVKLNEQPE